MKNILFLTFCILPLFTFSQFQIDSIVTIDASCSGGADGALTVYTSGGTSTVNYDIGSGSQTSNVFTGLSCGSYTVVAIDATPTTITGIGTVNCPSALTVISFSVDASCHSSCNGTIGVTVSGGVPPYSAVISPFGGSNPSFTSSAFFGNLCAGTYVVNITDANGCVEMISEIITEPSPIALGLASTPSSGSFCDGTASVSPFGGTPGYSIYWYDCVTGTPLGQSATTVTGLCAGLYGAIITDMNGCVGDSCIPVVVPTCNVTSTYFEVANTCFGSCDGMLDITTTGGVAPYLVTDPFGTVTSYSSFVSLYGYCAGTYTFLIEDVNGCTETIVATFMEPTPLVVTVSTTDETSAGACDGSIVATPFGGTAPYVFNFEDCNSGSPITIPGAVCSGDYSVTVMDMNACLVTSSCETVGTMSCNLTATYQVLQEPCFGQCSGVIDVTPVGGTSPYTVADPMGGSVISFTNNAILMNLCGMTQVLTITDANGCAYDLAVTVMELPPMVVDVTTSSETLSGACDGTAMANVSGGVGGPYLYSWFDCSTNLPIGNADTVTNLCAGDYYLVASDVFMVCSETSFCETVNPGATCNMVSTVQTTDAICYGSCDGSVLLNTSGGTLPYTVNDPMTGNVVTYSSAQVLSGLCPGSYTLVVEDASGCSEVFTIVITSPLEVLHTVTVIDESAIGVCDGSITVVATGGTPSYMYSINCSGFFQVSPVFSGLCNGAYGVTVEDANGCFSYCDSIDTVGTLNSVGVVINNFANVHIYPNPAKDEITIDFEGGDLNVSVFTVLGEFIYLERLAGRGDIDVSGWIPGIYILKLEVCGESVVKRLVVE